MIETNANPAGWPATSTEQPVSVASPAPAAPAAAAPKESMWSKVGSFFHHIEVRVSTVFTKIFGANAAHNFAVGAEQLLETQLGQIAWAAVNDAKGLTSGTEKAATAAADITAKAKSAGISTSTSLVNMLIELAVQRLNGAFGPAAS